MKHQRITLVCEPHVPAAYRGNELQVAAETQTCTSLDMYLVLDQSQESSDRKIRVNVATTSAVIRNQSPPDPFCQWGI